MTEMFLDVVNTVGEALRLAYNRDAAVAYAKKYWEQTASDGFIVLDGKPFKDGGPPAKWIGNAGSARFYHPVWSQTEANALDAQLGSNEELPDNDDLKTEVAVLPERAVAYTVGDDQHAHPIGRDSNLLLIGPMDDCTHFVSCCIGRPPKGTAGGLWIKPEFPEGPYGFVQPGRLFLYLVEQKIAQPIGSPKVNPPEKAPPAPTADTSNVRSLKRGDLIFYWFKPTDKPEDPPRYAHAAILLTDGTDPNPVIACHTVSRTAPQEMPPDRAQVSWNSDWKLSHLNPQYGFAHFKVP